MKMNWEKYGIDVSKVRGGKSICPKCSHTRKNKQDKCLSVDLETGLFNCHNCEFRGCAVVIEREKKTYERPQPRLQKVSQKVIDFFEKDRKISNNTLLRFKITEARERMPQFEKEVDCICFNYFRNDQLVNIKFRGPKKSFKMISKAELIFFNIDAIKGDKECVICEGEIDCMSFHESGIFNVVSVPNGASKGSQKLEYLDNCWEYFEGMEKIVLAVDNDEAGISLREELARRLGKEKCYRVAYPEGCKDANEVLVKFGISDVKLLYHNASEWPLEGVMTVDEMIPTLDEWYYEGYPVGDKAGIDGFDDLLSFRPGQLTIITGIPGHGKDEFTNYIMANLAKKHHWKFAMFGFEETTEETATKLMEKIVGKSFGFRKDPAHRISVKEYQNSLAIIDLYFFIVNHEDIETDIDSIITLAIQLVKRKGIKGLYINPWNWIEHNRAQGVTETEYVSLVLTKIIKFARRYSVHVFLLAHTTKMMKNTKTGKYDIPTLYSISGSANFFNKTHNGITIYRDYAADSVDVYVQKVKQSWLGKIGFTSFRFDTMTRQYVPHGTETPFPVGIGEGKFRPVKDLFTSLMDEPDENQN
jgi:twinkle protein